MLHNDINTHDAINCIIFFMVEVKCVVVGDSGAGKTCFVQTAALGEFPRKCVPSLFNNRPIDVQVGDTSAHLDIVDTPGGEDYERKRPLSYPQADVFIICFGVGCQGIAQLSIRESLPRLGY